MPSDSQQVQQIKDATDLIRLVGEQVSLKPRGKEYVGLCPFHNDKSPSLNVSPAKQIYKCYACGAGGDAFSFVMNYHKMDFPEAKKYLAERANIKLESRFDKREADNGSGVTRTQVYEANTQAVGFYRGLLGHAEQGKIAREYIAKRRISPEMVDAFQLGYAPDRWDGLATSIGPKRWNLPAFEAAGLVSARTNGPGYFDKLRHRIIFPIFDAIGRPVAFGGRKIRAEDEPKYLNSPETVVFNKSQTLYGLHLAKKPIQDTRTAVIVEGYTDVIGCHQAGVKNVVATLGTALTLQHVKHLRHFCDRVILIYDGDTAGLNASDKAVSVFLEGELDVYIAVIPGGKDPADLFEQPDGLDIWHKAIHDAKDALSYQFERVKQKLTGAQTITGRQKTAEEYLTKLVEMGVTNMSPVRRVLIVQRVGEMLGMPAGDVDGLLKRLAQSARPSGPRPTQDGQSAPSAPAGSLPGQQPARPVGVRPSQQGAGQGANQAVGQGANQGVGQGPMPTPDIDYSDGEHHFDMDHDGGPGSGDSAGQHASDSKVSADSKMASQRLGPQEALALLPVHQQQTLLTAERLLIGCLLLQNELFHNQALSDGRSVDESISPYDLADPVHQKLYELLYDQLAESKSAGIQQMLTHLAWSESHGLAGRLTQIEAETELQSMGKPENIRALFLDSTRLLIEFRLRVEKNSFRENVESSEPEHKMNQVLGLASRKIAEARDAQAGNTAPKIRIARIGKQRFT